VWEAKMEAELLRAESKYGAARNAEERERSMKKVNHAESPEDSPERQEEIFEAYRAMGLGVQPGNAPGGEAAELQPVYEDVAPDPKTQALRMKFG